MDIKIMSAGDTDEITGLTWHTWLQENLVTGVDYNILYWPDHWIVTITDLEKFSSFVSANSLD
jgi:hypothetical protein